MTRLMEFVGEKTFELGGNEITLRVYPARGGNQFPFVILRPGRPDFVISRQLAVALDMEFKLGIVGYQPEATTYSTPGGVKTTFSVNFPEDTPTALRDHAVEYAQQFLPLMVAELLALKDSKERKVLVNNSQEFWEQVSGDFVNGPVAEGAAHDGK